MFADDLCSANQTLHHYHDCSICLYECAGLKANLQKSQMTFGGCSQELQNQCLQITGLQECSFPLKYLGVPIIASRLTKIECRSLVEKILAGVHIWPQEAFHLLEKQSN